MVDQEHFEQLEMNTDYVFNNEDDYTFCFFQPQPQPQLFSMMRMRIFFTLVVANYTQ